jgi:hypothetical protein
MTPDALCQWLADTEPADAERTLLASRDELLRLAEESPHRCLELLDSVILPALRNAGELHFPLLIAFRLVRARLTAHGDEAFHSEIKAALALNLHGLAARGLMEWAHWSQLRGHVAEADRLYEQA